jgi:hypothetical protein
MSEVGTHDVVSSEQRVDDRMQNDQVTGEGIFAFPHLVVK